MTWRGRVAHPAIVVSAFALDLLLWGGDGRLRWGGSAPGVILAASVVLFAGLLAPLSRLRFMYVAAWTYTLVMAAVFPAYEPFTALLVVVHRIARTRPVRPALPYVAATALPWAANTANAALNTNAGFGGAAVIAVIWGIMTALAWMAARYAYGQDELARAREATAAAEMQLALQGERLRLARELHDIVAHSVSAVVLQAAGARHAMTSRDPVAAKALQTIETTSAQTMKELRSLLGLLVAAENGAEDSTGAADGADGVTLLRLADLDALVSTTRACDVVVDVSTSGVPQDLDAARQHVAYRVVQESLANVVRHGGRGSEASVTFTWSTRGLEIEVRSRPGPDLPETPIGGRSGLGLAGLRSRLAEVHGRLDAGPTPGGGFRVLAVLPPGQSPAATTPRQKGMSTNGEE